MKYSRRNFSESDDKHGNAYAGSTVLGQCGVYERNADHVI